MAGRRARGARGGSEFDVTGNTRACSAEDRNENKHMVLPESQAISHIASIEKREED